MKNYYQVKMQNRTVYVELKATQQDEQEIRNYFKDEIFNIQKLEKDEFENIKNKRIFELTPINFSLSSKNKELLNQTNQNHLRLTILEKQAKKYKEFLNSIRTQNKKVEKESKIKVNPDFLKIQEKGKEEIHLKTNQEKPIFISKKIEDLKIVSSKIKDKVIEFQESKNSKDELFKHLEQEIAQFEIMIEQLKEENRLLKQELELLIEQEQKGSEKSKLEKENSSLKDKIEALKNKDKTPFDEDLKDKKPLKLNKITYSQAQEQER